jgi:lincosamide and streptogramin A transport system ATP-binding/permease protein
MSLIRVSNLTFAYEGGGKIFEQVSFQIDTDWKLGFIGRNGRGKTTFLNLLLGKYEYVGNISAGAEFEYFPYEVTEAADTFDALRGVNPRFEQWELLRELSLLDVREDALYRPFETLSRGERTKVSLAALFCKDDRFLLLDEPTNHLDMHARKILGHYLKSKKGFILVSHDREFLDTCVDHVLSINRTNIEVQRGNFSSWRENKRRQDEMELAENERLKKDIKRLSEAARRTSDWSDKVEKTKIGSRNSGLRVDRGYVGHKAAKMMKRSKNIEARLEAQIEDKSGLLRNLESADDLKIIPLRYHTGTLARLENLSLYYGEKQVCDSVTFTIEQGDRTALCGKNGSGKSSILERVLGKDISFSGSFHVGSNLVVSHVPQDASFLRGGLMDFVKNHGLDESLFKAILRKLDFSREQFEIDMAGFSDGQKKKTLIAKSLCEKAHLYVWDEPLNFIDVFSRMQIEELLLRFAPTILFVEHDAAFCENVSTKKISLD